MRDRLRFLEDACTALIAGDPEACTLALDRFAADAARKPLTPDEEATCSRQLQRLRGLAVAAAGGIEATRSWLHELQKGLGGLDVYDRAGRQRVPTDLAMRSGRF